MQKMTIGQVAKLSEVSVETIRFYEKEGLLAVPQRNSSGYRQYTHETVKRIVFIQNAKQVGFTLKEIAGLLLLQENPNASCGDVLQKASLKLQQIEAKITELTRVKNALQQLTNDCMDNKTLAECPVLDALNCD